MQERLCCPDLPRGKFRQHNQLFFFTFLSQKGPDDQWIELPTGLSKEFRAGLLGTPCQLIRPDTDQSVVHVNHTENSGDQGDCLTDQPVRIARPVPPFMMMKNHLPREVWQGWDARGEASSELGVAIHLKALIVVEQSGFEQNRVGYHQLADVMQVSSLTEGVQIFS